MKQIVDDVGAFHDAGDLPNYRTARIPPVDRQILRDRLIIEEVEKELFPVMRATRHDSPFLSREEKIIALTNIATEIADSIYVLAGCALEYGIPLVEVWNAIQDANMRKVDPITGKMRHSDGTDGLPLGKVIKPPGWKKADIRSIIERHLEPGL